MVSQQLIGLQKDVLIAIFLMLDLTDTISLSLTCKHWKKLSDSDIHWKKEYLIIVKKRKLNRRKKII